MVRGISFEIVIKSKQTKMRDGSSKFSKKQDSPISKIKQAAENSAQQTSDGINSELEKTQIKRGFASMSPEKRKLIAAKGGQTSRGGGRFKKSEIVPIIDVDAKQNMRGFASMDAEKRKDASAKGGRISKGGGRPTKKDKK